jgi:hypothetical protein
MFVPVLFALLHDSEPLRRWLLVFLLPTNYWLDGQLEGGLHTRFVMGLSMRLTLSVKGWRCFSKCVLAWCRSNPKHPPLKHVRQTSTPLSRSCTKRVRRQADGMFQCPRDYVLGHQNIACTLHDGLVEKVVVV